MINNNAAEKRWECFATLCKEMNELADEIIEWSEDGHYRDRLIHLYDLADTVFGAKNVKRLLGALEKKDQRIAELERGQQKPAGYIDARCFEGKYPTGGSWSLQPHDIGGLNQVTPFYLSPTLLPGYKLVPVEPTEEMIAAAMMCDDVQFNSDETFCVNFSNIYCAMLAAASKAD